MDYELEVHEDLLGMAELSSATSQDIVSMIKDCLLRFNLPLANCRGQCYDGASVIAGSKSGVAASIIKVSLKFSLN